MLEHMNQYHLKAKGQITYDSHVLYYTWLTSDKEKNFDLEHQK